MANLPPPGVQPQPPAQNDSSAPLTPLSWEGEKMFNIYIYDYCFKRGFRKTAQELLEEADIPHDSTPPINARQGLLFEWWSVFWVLFQAKSNNGGSEDALLYTQHQQQQHQQRNARLQPAQGPMASAQGHPQQQSMQRQSMVPGMMNGMAANHVGQPLPPGSTPMMFMGGASGPQVNGIPGSHPPTPGGPPQGQLPQGPHQGGPQQSNFNSMMQQRTANGGPQQQPPPNGGLPQQLQQSRLGGPPPNMPFQSPTLGARSPNGGPGMQQGQQPGGPQQAPMGAIGGPSPLMTPMNRGSMLPPNGAPPQGMMMGGPQQQGPMPSGTPTQQFQQIGNTGRPPSRTNTPQMHGMMQQSPSLANRPTPMTDQHVANEFNRLSQQTQLLAQLKKELTLEKVDTQLTIADKRAILHHSINRSRQPPNAIAGPSNPGMAPNQPQRPPQQQPQQRGKRNSTSPGEEHETLPRTDSSPPDRKRPRRSPMETPAIPNNPNTMSYPQQPQQGPGLQQQHGPQGQPPQGQPPGQHQLGGMPQGMMMMNRQMQGQMMPNGHIPPPMNMQPSPQAQMQGGGINPQNQMGASHLGQMMMNPIGNSGYRVPLHQVHNAAGIMQPPNAGSPAGGPDPSFNPGPPNQGPPGPNFNNSRLLGPKPPHHGGMPPTGPMGGPNGNMMPPPPSPANVGKDAQGKDVKPKPDGSPSGVGHPPNQQGGPSQQNQGQPHQSQPNPGGPGTPQAQQQQSGNPTPQPGGPGGTTSPNNIMGGPGGASNSMGGLGSLNGLGDPMTMFGGDFAMTEFDPSSFDAGTLDFARDFGQWFNPDDMALGDAMK